MQIEDETASGVAANKIMFHVPGSLWSACWLVRPIYVNDDNYVRSITEGFSDTRCTSQI